MTYDPAAAAEAPALSIIIVAWNCADFVEQCIESVLQHAAGVPLEILLVDNASHDDIVPRVRARFPAVRILCNEQNVGFPVANNQALAWARGRYVLFLNPDTTVGPHTLRHCLAALAEDDTIGAVGCQLRLPDGSVQYECARATYRLRHLLTETLYLHLLLPKSRWFGAHRMSWWDHEGERDVDAVSGAFLMVRTDLAHELGGLPEDLFMYHEDLAFCLRVRRRGARIRYLGDVWAVHHTSRSSARSTLRLELLQHECKVLLIRDAEGAVAALAGRAIWGLAALPRLLLAGSAALLPNRARLRERWPRALDAGRHARQVVWAFAPWLVQQHMPKAPAQRTVRLVTG